MFFGLIQSRRYWKLCLPLYVFLVAHLGIYLISWVMIRYRVPADTVLIVFSGLAVSFLYNSLFDSARRGWSKKRRIKRKLDPGGVENSANCEELAQVAELTKGSDSRTPRAMGKG